MALSRSDDRERYNMLRNYKFALLTTVSPRAFENTPGWKMDGDKIAVDGDGNPIYINSAGTESAIKGDAIATLNNEARTHRTAKETAEAALAKYKGADGKLIDPDTAVKAIETIGKIDAKKLIDAGEVDKVKETIKAEFTQQLVDKDARITALEGDNNGMRIAKVFDGSEFVRDKLAVPKDMFEATFKSNFKIGEGGKVEAYGRDGNRLMSKTNVGEYATGDEALALLVESHPQKDVIMKAAQSGGSGNDGKGGSQGKGRVIKRGDFDAMNPGDQVAIAAAIQKGEAQVVD